MHEKGYVAVDFYDGSIMNDFSTDRIAICDIDFFRKAPVVNDRGEEWFGTKRLKAPEEYEKGGIIDEQANIFTLGALIYAFFGVFTDEEIQKRYSSNQFLPCAHSRWQLNEESYQVARRAVRPDKEERYRTFGAFFAEWKMSNGVCT